MDVLRKITMEARSVDPEACFIGEYFNCSCHKQGSPLAVHLRSTSWGKLGTRYVGNLEDLTSVVTNISRSGS